MSTNSSNVITIRGLVKHYGSFRALNGLDLTVKEGEVHGFLGPNGSGKSTTIRILLGLLRKTDGGVSLLGGDPWNDAVRLHKRLAYVPGEVNFWPNLSGGEVIDLLCYLRGNGLDKQRRNVLLQRFELDPKRKFHTYSKGNRQKVALIAALTSDADLYILDEPTSGLDPLMEALFQESVKELKANGKTVLLSSHILAEVEALCTTVTIIREGKTVEHGTLTGLRKLHHTSMTLETGDSLRGLEKVPGVHKIMRQDNKISFTADPKHMGVILSFLGQHNISNLTSHPPALEDLFLRHYDTSDVKES